MNGNVVVAWESRRETQRTLFEQRSLLGRDVLAVCAVDPLPFRHTLRPLRGATDELVTRQREFLAAHEIEAWADRLRAEGVDVEATVVRGDLVDALIRGSVERGSSAIAVAARPPPAVFGSTLARLARHAPVPVLVVREPRRSGATVQRLAVPLDLSAGADRVAPSAIEFAAAHDAEVVLVAAGDPFNASVRAAIDAAERQFSGAGVSTRIQLAGPVPLRRLGAVLEEEAPDVIAVATQPRSSSSIGGAPSERLIAQLLLDSDSSLLVVGDQPQRSSLAARPACRRQRLAPRRVTRAPQEVRG